MKYNAKGTDAGRLRCKPVYSFCRAFMGVKKNWRLAIGDERGFLAMQFLVFYMIFLLTILGFIFSLGIGMWKNAAANYMWFSEALEFATQAANETGDIVEVKSNRIDAAKYFNQAMREFEVDYNLISFDAVNKGDRVHRDGTAMAPGYMATIEVPVFKGRVPLIGEQEVIIPMRYFAVAKSKKIS